MKKPGEYRSTALVEKTLLRAAMKLVCYAAGGIKSRVRAGPSDGFWGYPQQLGEDFRVSRSLGLGSYRVTHKVGSGGLLTARRPPLWITLGEDFARRPLR